MNVNPHAQRPPYDPRYRAQPQVRRSRLLPWLIRIPLLGATAILLLFFIAAIYLALHQLQYDKRIFPGVSAYGTDLSGMTREQAAASLAARFTYGDEAIFTFRDGAQVWQKSAKDLGVQFDPMRTVEEAYKVGRGGSIFNNLIAQSNAWLNGTAIQPIIVFDQSRASAVLDQIGAEINQPVQDATILVRGTVVTTTPSQIGRQLDVGATLGKVREIVLNMNTGGEIPLIVRETKPTIPTTEDAGAKIRAALSGPIQLFVPGATSPGPWQATPDFVAGLLTVTRVDNADGTARYEVGTNLEPLKAFLKTLAPDLTVQAENARFVFNDSSRQLEIIKESVNGRELDIAATAEAFQHTIFRTENRQVPLVFQTIVPTVNSTSTGRELGITEEIAQTTTFFYGSTAERRTNIQVAASKFHGLVIAPGEEFSFNKYLGDVSPETGYETGLVIFGDRTIQGVGGGVCQVSTTIFQAAFFSGFPIKERYAHGYRVGYYESGSTIANGQRYRGGVGLDATVYSPLIDLKFVNDTPYHLLMEAYFDPAKQSLTFKFYSTSVGRIVTMDGPRLSNPVPHGPPKYTESADLRPGQTRQIDYAVDGIDARVYRTVKQGETVLINNEEFYSHYLPWSAQFLVAPGAAPRR